MSTLPDRWLLVLLAWTGLHVLLACLILALWTAKRCWLWLGLALVVMAILLGDMIGIITRIGG